jgi:hypothetical protein
LAALAEILQEGEPMTRPLSWIVAAVFLAATPVYAQSHAGIRAGVSGNPDQFFFGGHVETSPLAEHLTFRPNVEVGVGNDTTLLAFNFEFAYWVPMQKRHPWSLYFGGGPAANLYSFGGGGPGRRNSDLTGGFNALVGIQHREGLFTELKVGAIDSPTVKFTVGYVFK